MMIQSYGFAKVVLHFRTIRYGPLITLYLDHEVCEIDEKEKEKMRTKEFRYGWGT